MKKLLIFLSVVFCFQSKSILMSQTLALYKADNKITSELFDVYLLLYPSGKYYLIAEDNYGEPVKNFYEDKPFPSDVLPAETLLSFGKYSEKGDKITLTNSWLHYQQVFSFGENCLIGIKSFDFLKGKSLFPIKQSKQEYLDEKKLEYIGGILWEEDYAFRYDSMTNRFEQALINQENRIKTNDFISAYLRDGKYVNSRVWFYLTLDKHQFEFYLGPMLLLKGDYKLLGNKLLLISEKFDNNFTLRIINDSTVISIVLPGLLPGEEFKIKHIQ